MAYEDEAPDEYGFFKQKEVLGMKILFIWKYHNLNCFMSEVETLLTV